LLFQKPHNKVKAGVNMEPKAENHEDEWSCIDVEEFDAL
jgi:hypothetical protein